MGGTLLEGGAADVPDPAMEAMNAEEEVKDKAEREFNHFLAYPLAFIGAIFFGVGNFILAIVGYEEGIDTFFP